MLVESHPVRVRGLKHPRIKLPSLLFVAPRAGAWVETTTNTSRSMGWAVAPRAGAWVETKVAMTAEQAEIVAPRAGAWVETG